MADTTQYAAHAAMTTDRHPTPARVVTLAGGHIVGSSRPKPEAELLRNRAGYDDWAGDVVAAVELRRQSRESEQPEEAPPVPQRESSRRRRLNALTAFLHH